MNGGNKVFTHEWHGDPKDLYIRILELISADVIELISVYDDNERIELYYHNHLT